MKLMYGRVQVELHKSDQNMNIVVFNYNTQ